MKIAVVAAAGRAGKKIVAEAAAHGIEVTAFVRKLYRLKARQKLSRKAFWR